jgi:hypothetical protein
MTKLIISVVLRAPLFLEFFQVFLCQRRLFIIQSREQMVHIQKFIIIICQKQGQIMLIGVVGIDGIIGNF